MFILNDASYADYNEAEALQEMYLALCKQAEETNRLIEAGEEPAMYLKQFTITVDGEEFAFINGGPQLAAIECFIKHLAYENFYYVELESGIVTDH